MDGLVPKFIVQTPPVADPQWPPPFRFSNTAVQLFQVEADGKKLQLECDRFLNDISTQTHSTISIDPLMGNGLNIVNIMLMHYPKMECIAPGYENLGYTEQNELAFAIPVVLRQSGILIAIGTYMPYLFVDNYMSMVTGRDVVGFAKTGANFQTSGNIRDSNNIKISTLAAETASPSTRTREQPLFETVTDAQQTEVAIELEANVAQSLWPYGPVNELYATDKKFAVDKEIYKLLEQQAGINMASYAFKQFRDAQSPADACLQAIVAADTTTSLDDFEVGGKLPKTKIKLHRYASLDIAERLGIYTKGDIINPINSIWYRASFTYDNVRNLVIRYGKSGYQRNPRLSCLPLIAKSAYGVFRFYEGAALAWLRFLEGSGHEKGGKSR